MPLSHAIPIDRAVTMSSLVDAPETKEIGEAWQSAIVVRMQDSYDAISECLRDYRRESKADAVEWPAYLEVIDSEIVEVWSPEWPPGFTEREARCFNALVGTRIQARDPRRLIREDFALVL
jgi:hypothetical protein